MQVSDRDLRYLRREMLREVDSLRQVSYRDAVSRSDEKQITQADGQLRDGQNEPTVRYERPHYQAVTTLQNKEPARNTKHLQQETIDSDKDTESETLHLSSSFILTVAAAKLAAFSLTSAKPSSM